MSDDAPERIKHTRFGQPEQPTNVVEGNTLMNANDRFRALQAALIEMGTALALEHGFDPTEVRVRVDVRLPPEAKMIRVSFTESDLT